MKWRLLAVACVLLALGLLLYPLMGELVSEKYHSDVEAVYTAAIADTDNVELAEQRRAAEAYNALLRGEAAVSTGGASVPPVDYAEQLTVGGAMCTIDIPKIGVYLPVRHGTGVETLERAVGHVVGTSLPVGGAGTHAVLSAHSGMASAKLFSDIDQLVKGDVFYIHVLGEVLAYEVDQIATVLPSDTSLLQIEEDKDYVTLITCMPFGVNTHRLLVRGHRVPYVPEMVVENGKTPKAASSWTQHYLTAWASALVCWLRLAGSASLQGGNAVGKKSVLLAAALAVAGLCILLWPVVSGHRLQADMSAAAQGFWEEARQPYSEVLTDLQEYNERIYAERQAGLADALACEEPAVLLRDCGVEDEIIGVLELPTLELVMPVYLGASDSHLAAGAAVLGNTSAPIGGVNTNCVIAGHRGWYGADYFRHIDRLQAGDMVTVTNLWETLTYTVVDMKIIQPDQVDKIKIQPGRDLLTLITCHPYASGGRQRLVVYCERRK